MISIKKTYITAILSMAVIFCGLLLVNCVTPRHIEELKTELNELKQQNQNTQDMVTRMDTIIATSAEANNKMRNDIQFSVKEIQEQISALLENYNDLLTQLNKLNSKENVKTIIHSSPGSQQQNSATIYQDNQSNASEFDCDKAYDDAFLLVHGSEYDNAITEFKIFLEKCPEHSSIDDAYYWVGESYYFLGKYHESVEYMNKLYTEFRNSPKIEQAIYKLARSNQELGKTKESKEFYQLLVKDYPGTLEAQQAKERLKDLK